MFFQKDIETMDRKSMQSLQLDKLKHMVNYCYDKVPMYTQKFDSVGLKPKHIQTLKDISLIPYTTKEDLRENYPYGLFAVPQKEIVRLHASSGTTGKPIVAGYTRYDLDMWSDCMARLITAVGGNDEDIVQISFGYGLFTGALGVHMGWEKIGASVVPASSGNTAKQIMLLEDFGVTALVATPSYAMYIAESIKNKNLPMENFRLRLGLFGAEASTEEMHRELSQTLGILSTDNYGLTELIGPGVSGDCHLRCGMHINEDHFYPEIVNIAENKVLNEGEEGELLFTALSKQGMPILRYRTKDISSLNFEPCKCGRTSVRMGKIKGRTDDMLIIRGVNVFPSQIEAVLMNIEEIGNHYEILVTRENYLDKLTVSVEMRDESLLESYGKLEQLRNYVAGKIKEVLGLEVGVKLVEPFSLKRYEGKTQRVHDMRNK
ncbi:MAG: phenylacetate--CoA ligase [Bacillota bacterium]